MSLLELDNIHTYYGHIHALKGISLKVEKGEVVTLIGANGAGKSTTLRAISGLVHTVQDHITETRDRRGWKSPNIPVNRGRIDRSGEGDPGASQNGEIAIRTKQYRRSHCRGTMRQEDGRGGDKTYP